MPISQKFSFIIIVINVISRWTVHMMEEITKEPEETPG